MKNFSVSDLLDNMRFDSPVYLDKKYILLAPEVPVSRELIFRLRDWGYKSVLTEGSGEVINEEDIDEAERMFADLEDHPMSEAMNRYFDFIDFAELLFEAPLIKAKPPLQKLKETGKMLVHSMKDFGYHLLRYNQFDHPSDNYVIKHSVHVAILSVAVASAMGLSLLQQFELAIAALVHDIGMAIVPKEIALKKDALSPAEKRLVEKHVLRGFAYLRKIGIPERLAMPALQHHERSDGSGYPQQLQKSKLSLYSRIVAVTCSFDGAISARPYKESLNIHEALIDILRTRGKQYDRLVTNALNSFFRGIEHGKIVLLSDGRQGVVLNADPEDTQVRILKNSAGESIERHEVVHIYEVSDLQIMRILEGKI